MDTAQNNSPISKSPRHRIGQTTKPIVIPSIPVIGTIGKSTDDAVLILQTTTVALQAVSIASMVVGALLTSVVGPFLTPIQLLEPVLSDKDSLSSDDDESFLDSI